MTISQFREFAAVRRKYIRGLHLSVPMMCFLGAIVFLTICSGSDRLLGDEVGYANSHSWHAFRELRFYRILGEPIHIATYRLLGRYPAVMTALSALFITGVMLLMISVLLQPSRPLFASMGNSLPALMVLATPFSIYGISIRLVTTQMLASALMACGCAAASAYARYPLDQALKRRLLILGTGAYGISLFVYEITLLAPLLLLTILYISSPPGLQRRENIRKWLPATAIPFGVYISSQIAFISQQPKLSRELAALTIGRAESGFLGQVTGKLQVLADYSVSAWSVSMMDATRGDWHFWAAIPAVCLAGVGAWLSSGRIEEHSRTSGGKCLIMGAALFACTIGLWTYYLVKFHVLSTPPLYTALLPATGLALIAFGLFVAINGESRIRRMGARIFVTVIVCTGVANNAAFLNAARIAKRAPDAEANRTLLTGQR